MSLIRQLNSLKNVTNRILPYFKRCDVTLNPIEHIFEISLGTKTWSCPKISKMPNFSFPNRKYKNKL